jgi:quinol monooxygenase YgiN
MTPWNHWRMPAIVENVRSALDHGPALVTVQYRVRPHHAEPFLRAVQKYARIRRRDGAWWWGIFRDLEDENLYVETFLTASWAEHLRQHDRFTRADRDVEAQISEHVVAEATIRHLIDTGS